MSVRKITEHFITCFSAIHKQVATTHTHLQLVVKVSAYIFNLAMRDLYLILVSVSLEEKLMGNRHEKKARNEHQVLPRVECKLGLSWQEKTETAETNRQIRVSRAESSEDSNVWTGGS